MRPPDACDPLARELSCHPASAPWLPARYTPMVTPALLLTFHYITTAVIFNLQHWYIFSLLSIRDMIYVLKTMQHYPSFGRNILHSLPVRCIESYLKLQWFLWSTGSVLAFGTQVRGFKPGRSRRIFQGEKIPQHAFLRKGSKAVCPMS